MVAYCHRRLSRARSFAEGVSLPGFPEGLEVVVVAAGHGLTVGGE